MDTGVYYDWRGDRALDGENGATFSEWMETTSHPAPFAIHPDGFRVFLPANEIRKFDEYAADGDPYAVAAGIDSPFHEQRQRVTLELVGEGLRTAPFGVLPKS